MIRGKELEKVVYEYEHIQQILAEIDGNFANYFESFSSEPLRPVFDQHIKEYEKEQKAYREYLDMEALAEFDYDPNLFKSYTRKHCPIIRRCLMSQDEMMKQYKIDFSMVSGSELLSTVRHIAEFGRTYVSAFDDRGHEESARPDDLGLDILNTASYGCVGVIGYGIQSSLLYGLHPQCFAHRSQNAVWSLYFLAGRKEFGLADGSEFLMVRPDLGTCEQNYFYPAELFGFYALEVFLLLKAACQSAGVHMRDRYRYVYLSTFCDHVAEAHREDIDAYKWSSEHVESQPWF